MPSRKTVDHGSPTEAGGDISDRLYGLTLAEQSYRPRKGEELTTLTRVSGDMMPPAGWRDPYTSQARRAFKQCRAKIVEPSWLGSYGRTHTVSSSVGMLNLLG